MTPSPAAQQPTGVHLALTVSLDGRPLSMLLQGALSEVRVTRAVRTVGSCVLRFVDPTYAVSRSGALALGTAVTVTGRKDTARSRSSEVFAGEITGVTLENGSDGRAELLVTVQDRAHRLGRRSRAVAYLDLGYGEIVSQLASHAGLSVGSASGPLRPYVLQAGSDLELVNDLTGRLGQDWVVTGTTLDVWRPEDRLRGAVAVTLTLGQDIHDLSVRLTSSAASTVTVRGTDPVTDKVVTADRSRSTLTSNELTRIFSPAAAGAVSVLDTTSNPLTGQEAAELAEAVLSTDGNVVVRGRLPFEPDLVPGCAVALDGAGPSSGTYYVREVTHTFTTSGLRTELVAGDQPRTSLRAALGVERGRGSSSFTHEGLVIGQVSDVDDPKRLGRVKVTFRVLSETVTSDWARVASVGGGSGRGLFALPEIDDEVLLGFEGADVRRPVVLSGLYGPASPPPGVEGAHRDGKVLTRAITSRLGHVVELADGADDATQHVLIGLAGDQHRLRLGKDRTDLVVPDGVPVTITSGTSTIRLDGRGAISVKGTTVTVEAEQKLSLKAAEIDISAQAALTLSGATAELAGQGSTTVKASGTTSVSGGMVMIN